MQNSYLIAVDVGESDTHSKVWYGKRDSSQHREGRTRMRYFDANLGTFRGRIQRVKKASTNAEIAGPCL